MLNRMDRMRERQAMRQRIRVAVALRRLATQQAQPEPQVPSNAAE